MRLAMALKPSPPNHDRRGRSVCFNAHYRPGAFVPGDSIGRVARHTACAGRRNRNIAHARRG